MVRQTGILLTLIISLLLAGLTGHAAAVPLETIQSVVSVLPVRPGNSSAERESRRIMAPEGTGIVIREGGVIATAWHVVVRARRIDVRLSDGRILPAQLLAKDDATDIALLEVEASLPKISTRLRPEISTPACVIGNAYGLGLSVACGVVSALDVSKAGFNAVEDFVQTDAAANPGTSGGALVDREGRLVGMVSAIFAGEGDGNVGVNFAVSTELLLRVVDDLLDDGKVDFPSPGWQLAKADRAQLAERAGVVVSEISDSGPADMAGIKTGDLITQIGERRILKPRDAIAALAILRPAAGPVDIILYRDGAERVVPFSFDAPKTKTASLPRTPAVGNQSADCPHPVPVCQARQAVFPISSLNPIASATRIGPSLLITNRHVVGDRPDAIVMTPSGQLTGVVVPSAYKGDLALIEVDGLPPDGHILAPEGGEVDGSSRLFSIGADVSRQEVRVFDPGEVLLPPAENARLGRLHVTALMQPGVSGGALVDSDGRLIGIAVGGGEGRYEAIPVDDVNTVLDLRVDPAASAVHSSLGSALARCEQAIEDLKRGPTAKPGMVFQVCRDSENQGQFLQAGRALAKNGNIAPAIRLHQLAVEQTPNSINARLSLLVSLQLGGRFEDMLSHARWIMNVAPDDPSALRLAIQPGVWGGDVSLAEEAYRALLKADPRQAQAARRFIDSAPPAPPRR